MAEQFRGIYAIPVTPFDASGELDETSLRRCITFCLEAGAHGIVGPVNVSEFFTLTDAERQRVVEIMQETVAGQIPVVAAVHAPSTARAVYFAKHAKQVGVDAVIAMPPYIQNETPDNILTYYRRIAETAECPVFIQNNMPPLGTALSATFMAQIIAEVDGVTYVKEETAVAGQVMTQLFEKAGDKLEGVMGGLAGRFLLDEYARGACGTMPGCEFADIHTQLWDALEHNDQEATHDLYTRLLPLLLLEGYYKAVPVCKMVLWMRGIIETPLFRQPGLKSLDAIDTVRLQDMLLSVADLLTTAPLVRKVST